VRDEGFTGTCLHCGEIEPTWDDKCPQCGAAPSTVRDLFRAGMPAAAMDLAMSEAERAVKLWLRYHWIRAWS